MAFWPAWWASTLMRSLGLVATQTFTVVCADIGGSVAMWQRPGSPDAEVLAGGGRLMRAALHGG